MTSTPNTTSRQLVSSEKRASYLELFFDLVFVFAITQLADMLHRDHSATGWGHAALMAWLIWWAWSQFTWAGNAIDIQRRSVRIAVLAVTGLMLLAAAAMPASFDGRGLWFAIPYVTVRLGALGLYWSGLRDDPSHQDALRTYVPIAVISPVLVLIGGFAAPSVRVWMWCVALLIDVTSALAAGRGEFRVSPGHFAERHALIVIIALGEAVIAVGAAVSQFEIGPAVIASTAAGFALVAALWWAYFDWMASSIEDRLSAEQDNRIRAHLARDVFTFGHLPLVTGTVALAVGLEEALLHPREPLNAFGRLALAVGVVLVMGGFLVCYLRATRRLLVVRALGLGVLVVAIEVGARAVSALTTLVLTAIALIVVSVLEAITRRPGLESAPNLRRKASA